MSYFLSQTSIRIDEETPILSPSPVLKNPEKIGFNPILTYIEGYAYNSKGEIIHNAQILIKLKNGDQLFYKTTADENGFFRIYSKNLPFFEYYLNIVDPKTNQTFKQTTSEFVKLNKNYLTTQKLDLIKSTKEGTPIINSQTKERNVVFNQNSYLIPTSLPQKPLTSSFKSKNQLMILLVILIFLFLILGLLFYYFFQKNKVKI